MGAGGLPVPEPVREPHPLTCLSFLYSEGSNLTPAHHFQDFRFKTYAPVAFRYFRELFGIRPDDYLVSGGPRAHLWLPWGAWLSTWPRFEPPRRHLLDTMEPVAAPASLSNFLCHHFIPGLLSHSQRDREEEKPHSACLSPVLGISQVVLGLQAEQGQDPPC